MYIIQPDDILADLVAEIIQDLPIYGELFFSPYGDYENGYSVLKEVRVYGYTYDGTLDSGMASVEDWVERYIQHHNNKVIHQGFPVSPDISLQ